VNARHTPRGSPPPPARDDAGPEGRDTHPGHPAEDLQDPGTLAYRKAWWAIAGLPISAFLGLVTMLALCLALSPNCFDIEQDPATHPDPLWVTLLGMGIPALVFAAPALNAVRLGAHASRHGRPGWIPATVAVTVVVVVLTLVFTAE
jgi:hypothetical protein